MLIYHIFCYINQGMIFTSFIIFEYILLQSILDIFSYADSGEFFALIILDIFIGIFFAVLMGYILLKLILNGMHNH